MSVDYLDEAQDEQDEDAQAFADLVMRELRGLASRGEVSRLWSDELIEAWRDALADQHLEALAELRRVREALRREYARSLELGPSNIPQWRAYRDEMRTEEEALTIKIDAIRRRLPRMDRAIKEMRARVQEAAIAARQKLAAEAAAQRQAAEAQRQAEAAQRKAEAAERRSAEAAQRGAEVTRLQAEIVAQKLAAKAQRQAEHARSQAEAIAQKKVGWHPPHVQQERLRQGYLDGWREAVYAMQHLMFGERLSREDALQRLSEHLAGPLQTWYESDCLQDIPRPFISEACCPMPNAWEKRRTYEQNAGDEHGRS